MVGETTTYLRVASMGDEATRSEDWGLFDAETGAWMVGHGGVPWRGTRGAAHAKVADLAGYAGYPEWEARRASETE
jgi:hypothetical protein